MEEAKEEQIQTGHHTLHSEAIERKRLVSEIYYDVALALDKD